MVLSLSSGCVTTDTFQIKNKPEEKAPLALPPVHWLGMDPIRWYIITSERAADIFEKESTLFCLSPETYKTLAVDNKRVYFFIQKQKDQIDGYKKYYEPDKEK